MLGLVVVHCEGCQTRLKKQPRPGNSAVFPGLEQCWIWKVQPPTASERTLLLILCGLIGLFACLLAFLLPFVLLFALLFVFLFVFLLVGILGSPFATLDWL